MLREMTPAEILYLKTSYEQDSSFAYECSGDDLEQLLVIFGEMEPIIDAFNVLSGASIEQRAYDIGCSPEDFSDEWGSVEYPITLGYTLPNGEKVSIEINDSDQSEYEYDKMFELCGQDVPFSVD